MKKILAFSGSNSSVSINQQLLEYIIDRVPGHEIDMIKLTDYPLPIYSRDIEVNKGIPENVKRIKELIDTHDSLIIAVNEHNGASSAFFKNNIDWLSRLKKDFLNGKKILLFSTSPGKRGGQSSLEYTRRIFVRFGGQVIESFSFPSFRDNFENGKMLNEILDMGIQDVLTTFSQELG